MTLTETTAPAQSDTLSFELDLPHAAEKVWRALTEPALLAEWLLPTVGHQLQAGASFRFQAPAQPGWDGIVDCRYLEIEPTTKISWAWVAGDLDTRVTCTLAPSSSGTRLTLVHSGFKPTQKQNFGGARYGWKMMGGKLTDLLARTA